MDNEELKSYFDEIGKQNGLNRFQMREIYAAIDDGIDKDTIELFATGEYEDIQIHQLVNTLKQRPDDKELFEGLLNPKISSRDMATIRQWRSAQPDRNEEFQLLKQYGYLNSDIYSTVSALSDNPQFMRKLFEKGVSIFDIRHFYNHNHCSDEMLCTLLDTGFDIQQIKAINNATDLTITPTSINQMPKNITVKDITMLNLLSSRITHNINPDDVLPILLSTLSKLKELDLYDVFDAYRYSAAYADFDYNLINELLNKNKDINKLEFLSYLYASRNSWRQQEPLNIDEYKNLGYDDYQILVIAQQVHPGGTYLTLAEKALHEIPGIKDLNELDLYYCLDYINRIANRGRIEIDVKLLNIANDFVNLFHNEKFSNSTEHVMKTRNELIKTHDKSELPFVDIHAGFCIDERVTATFYQNYYGSEFSNKYVKIIGNIMDYVRDGERLFLPELERLDENQLEMYYRVLRNNRVFNSYPTEENMLKTIKAISENNIEKITSKEIEKFANIMCLSSKNKER